MLHILAAARLCTSRNAEKRVRSFWILLRHNRQFLYGFSFSYLKVIDQLRVSVLTLLFLKETL